MTSIETMAGLLSNLPERQRVGVLLLVPEACPSLANRIAVEEDSQAVIVLEAIRSIVASGMRVSWAEVCRTLDAVSVVAVGLDRTGDCARNVPRRIPRNERGVTRTSGGCGE